MRFPTDDIEPRPEGRADADGATLPLRGLTAARLGADDALPVWQRLPDGRFFLAVAGPGPSSFEGTDPIRATRRAHRVLESLHEAVQQRPLEATLPGFAPLAIAADDTDPLPVLSSEVQLAAAEHHRESGRVRLFTTGDARAYYLDAVALCRLSFEDAPIPGLTGPSALWLRTVDVRPSSAGLLLVVTHGAHGHFAAPWLFERAVVAAFERSTSWRGFCEQLRFALDRETRSGASFAALPVGGRDFAEIREAILGPGGQRLADLAARQASSGGAAWLSAWLSLYGPLHERWRWTLGQATRTRSQEVAARKPEPAPVAAPAEPPANTDVDSSAEGEEPAPVEAETPPPEARVPAPPAEPSASPAPDTAAREDRPPNWTGVADALNRLSAEWARANKQAATEARPETIGVRPRSPVTPLRLLRTADEPRVELEGRWPGRRAEAAARQLDTTPLLDTSIPDPEPDPAQGELPDEMPSVLFEMEPEPAVSERPAVSETPSPDAIAAPATVPRADEEQEDSVETLLSHPVYEAQDAQAQVSARPAAAPARPRWNRGVVVAAALVCLAAGIGIGLWSQHATETTSNVPESGTTAPTAGDPSVVALRAQELTAPATRRAPERPRVQPRTSSEFEARQSARAPERSPEPPRPPELEARQSAWALERSPEPPRPPELEIARTVWAPIDNTAPTAALPSPAPEVVPEALPEGAVSATSRVYAVVRRGPGAQYQRVRILAPGDTAVVVARRSGTHWVRLERGNAWVSTKRGRLVDPSGAPLDLDRLASE